mgnify:CR=1 FL=1
MCDFPTPKSDQEKIDGDMFSVKFEHDFNDALTLRNLSRWGRSTMDLLHTLRELEARRVSLIALATILAAAPQAAAMGPQQKAALDAEIRRQLKPNWRPPSGADADQLVTLLEVRLDKNGAVIGTPEVIDQLGVTASNRPQAKLHAERAIQAVKLASPFRNLPPEYYEQWKWLRPLRFDARLTR